MGILGIYRVHIIIEFKCYIVNILERWWNYVIYYIGVEAVTAEFSSNSDQSQWTFVNCKDFILVNRKKNGWSLRLDLFTVLVVFDSSLTVTEHFQAKNNQLHLLKDYLITFTCLQWSVRGLVLIKVLGSFKYVYTQFIAGSQPIVPTPASGCVWLNSDAVKHRVETTSIMSRQPLPINSIDILGSSLLIAGDNEAIYLVENVVA